MLAKHVARQFTRHFFKSRPNRILSSNFALENEWAARHSDLAKLGLGGDYEWISAVQKKFIGGGYASAVDVDAAVCVAEQKDQLDDVVELLYKLRHSVKAAEKLESSEYAIVRLLLKYQPETILTFANDSINYGIFLNTHLACVVIDGFLKTQNIQAAARIVTWMVQQEELDNELLNVLGLYVCAKWAELPAEQQTIDLGAVEEEEDVNDDDIRTFKFPYLKNEHFDEHFDLTNAHHLIGKSLMWMARDSRSLNEDLRKSLQFLGAVYFEKLEEAANLASSLPKNSPVGHLVRQKLEKVEEPSEAVKSILEKIGENENTDGATTTLSSLLAESLKSIQIEEENKLCEMQKAKFVEWSERRLVLVKSQAQKVLLKVRNEEIHAELKKLDEIEEQMSFFQNRLMWEKKANENTEIDNEAKLRNEKRLATA
uniref:28S ribosomal protein S27, mitochondrial n=1 Tax=Caenorhabditis japonica TaxID=281687 RepID=A0A8R1HVZ3_CAEJA